MSELTREQIIKVREHYSGGFPDELIVAVCDVALRTLDAEKRAEQARAENVRLQERLIQSRDERDTARQEAANLREEISDQTAIFLDRSKEMSQSSGYGRGFSDAMEECRERVLKILHSSSQMDSDGSESTTSDAPASEPEPHHAKGNPTVRESAHGGYVWTYCDECGPDVSVDKDGLCGMCGRDAVYFGKRPAPVDRPETDAASEALPPMDMDTITALRDMGMEEGEVLLVTGDGWGDIYWHKNARKLAALLRQTISQPAPAVPDAVWRNLRKIEQDAPKVFSECACTVRYELERALATHPADGDSPAVPAWIAKRVLAARKAILDGDDSEAWHQLYGIADPTYTKRPNPWADLERIAAAPTPDEDGE